MQKIFLRSAPEKDTLIIISNIEWGYLKQRHQHFAMALRDVYNVVFVESLAKRNPTMRDIPRIAGRVLGLFRAAKKEKFVDESRRDITIITPIVLPSTFVVFRKLNSWFFTKILSRIILSKCPAHSRTIVLVYLPTATVLDIINFIKPDILLYDCVSNFEGVPEMPADTVDLEKKLIRQADMVFTDCDFLYNKHCSLAGAIELLEPGVNSQLFNSIQGEVCRNIKKVTYYGAINDKIDWDLLQFLVDRGLELTLIGPVKFSHALLKTVRHIPQVVHEQLPGQLLQADALIIPYISNEFMLGVIPAKFFECFATGKPIIATYSDNYQRYDDLILQGKSSEEIYDKIIHIQQYERSATQEKRVAIAMRQDWNILAQRIVAFIDSMS